MNETHGTAGESPENHPAPRPSSDSPGTPSSRNEIPWPAEAEEAAIELLDPDLYRETVRMLFSFAIGIAGGYGLKSYLDRP